MGAAKDGCETREDGAVMDGWHETGADKDGCETREDGADMDGAVMDGWHEAGADKGGCDGGRAVFGSAEAARMARHRLVHATLKPQMT